MSKAYRPCMMLVPTDIGRFSHVAFRQGECEDLRTAAGQGGDKRIRQLECRYFCSEVLQNLDYRVSLCVWASRTFKKRCYFKVIQAGMLKMTSLPLEELVRGP